MTVGISMTRVSTGSDAADRFIASRLEARALVTQATGAFLAALRNRGDLPHGQISAERITWLQKKYAALWRSSCATQRNLHGAPSAAPRRAPTGRERPRLALIPSADNRA